MKGGHNATAAKNPASDVSMDGWNLHHAISTAAINIPATTATEIAMISASCPLLFNSVTCNLACPSGHTILLSMLKFGGKTPIEIL